MSLSSELATELADMREHQTTSRITTFLNALDPQDREEFEEWLDNPANKSAMWRVLKRRGLDVAEVTFRNWVTMQCR